MRIIREAAQYILSAFKLLLDFVLQPGSLIVIAVLLIGVCIWGAVEGEKQWQQFAADHNCKVVGKTEGQSSVGTGVMSNGKVGMVTTYTPGQTGYLCDDGVTYWR